MTLINAQNTCDIMAVFSLYSVRGMNSNIDIIQKWHKQLRSNMSSHQDNSFSSRHIYEENFYFYNI